MEQLEPGFYWLTQNDAAPLEVARVDGDKHISLFGDDTYWLPDEFVKDFPLAKWSKRIDEPDGPEHMTPRYVGS